MEIELLAVRGVDRSGMMTNSLPSCVIDIVDVLVYVSMIGLLCAGTSSGSMHLFDVSTDLYQPDRDEADVFYEKIGKRIAHANAQPAPVSSALSSPLS